MLPNHLYGMSESMFKTLGTVTAGPTSEEMLQAAAQLERPTKVKFTQYVTKIYDLGSPADLAAYNSDMTTLIAGLTARTHVLFNKDRQFVPDRATWLVSMEWGEYVLEDIVNERA